MKNYQVYVREIDEDSGEPVDIFVDLVFWGIGWERVDDKVMQITICYCRHPKETNFIPYKPEQLSIAIMSEKPTK